MDRKDLGAGGKDMTADPKRDGEIRNVEERLQLLEKVIEDVPDGIQIVDLEG